jgi:tRNA A37 threonylcarbamoyladenosine dehydratase
MENVTAINPRFQRLALITGTDIMNKLKSVRVLIFGVGGVGSWCAEALVRSGIGKVGIVDYDTVCVTNINRQIQAASSTLGCAKVEVLKNRLAEINPDCELNTWTKIFTRKNAAEFDIEKTDYIIDAIDTLVHKLDLIEISYTAGVKLFSSMGMAKKIDPTRIKVAGIWETHGCPLARLVRQGVRKRSFYGSFTTVYSDEHLEQHDECAGIHFGDTGKKVINGSVVTVTASAGMVLASLVLRDIMGKL